MADMTSGAEMQSSNMQNNTGGAGASDIFLASQGFDSSSLSAQRYRVGASYITDEDFLDQLSSFTDNEMCKRHDTTLSGLHARRFEAVLRTSNERGVSQQEVQAEIEEARPVDDVSGEILSSADVHEQTKKLLKIGGFRITDADFLDFLSGHTDLEAMQEYGASLKGVRNRLAHTIARESTRLGVDRYDFHIGLRKTRRLNGIIGRGRAKVLQKQPTLAPPAVSASAAEPRKLRGDDADTHHETAGLDLAPNTVDTIDREQSVEPNGVAAKDVLVFDSKQSMEQALGQEKVRVHGLGRPKTRETVKGGMAQNFYSVRWCPDEVAFYEELIRNNPTWTYQQYADEGARRFEGTYVVAREHGTWGTRISWERGRRSAPALWRRFHDVYRRMHGTGYKARRKRQTDIMGTQATPGSQQTPDIAATGGMDGDEMGLDEPHPSEPAYDTMTSQHGAWPEDLDVQSSAQSVADDVIQEIREDNGPSDGVQADMQASSGSHQPPETAITSNLSLSNIDMLLDEEANAALPASRMPLYDSMDVDEACHLALGPTMPSPTPPPFAPGSANAVQYSSELPHPSGPQHPSVLQHLSGWVPPYAPAHGY